MDTDTLKRRGSGMSISLGRNNSVRGGNSPAVNRVRPTSMHMDFPQQWPGAMHHPGHYPILVNPPPMPTVIRFNTKALQITKSAM